MHDRISTYRQVRLILNPADGSWQSAYWHLHLLDVRKGIPHARILEDGIIVVGKDQPQAEDFWAALADITASLAGRR